MYITFFIFTKSLNNCNSWNLKFALSSTNIFFTSIRLNLCHLYSAGWQKVVDVLLRYYFVRTAVKVLYVVLQKQ